MKTKPAKTANVVKAVNDPKALNEPNVVVDSHLVQKSMNEWTVMVYLAGDNNLAEEMVYALTAMESVGSNPPDYEIFALYDAGLGPAPLKIRDRFTPALGLLQQAEESRKAEGDQRVLHKVAELRQAFQAQGALQATASQISQATKILTSAAGSAYQVVTPPQSGSTLASILKAFGNQKDEELGSATALNEQAKEEADVAKSNQAAMDAFSKAATPEAAMNALEKLKPESEAPDSVQSILTNFVINTIRAHPARNYMLVLSGHGSGAAEDFLGGNNRFLGLSIPELRESLKAVKEQFQVHDPTFHDKDGKEQRYLKDGKIINILGLDSCLMGMAETAYEVRHYVDYLVGAEGFEPNTGWPYDRILDFLRVNLYTATVKDLARDIVREYIAFYSSDYTLAEVSTDQTALELGAIEPFAVALGELSQLLIDDLEDKGTRDVTKDNLLLAHWEAQGFKFEQHVDVYDFCELLQKRYYDAKKKDQDQHPIWKACEKVKHAIEELRVYSDYCGPKFQYARGVSIFFPWANITDTAGVKELDHYQSLEFANTHWDEFVRTYHRYTQRLARPGNSAPHLSALNRREGLFTGKPGKFNVPGAIRFNVPGAIRFNVPGAIRFNVPGAIRFNVPGAIRFNVPGAIRFGSAANFEVSKIASMKNPPIIWFSQKK